MVDTPLPRTPVKDPSRLSLALQSDFIHQFKHSPVAIVSFAVTLVLVLGGQYDRGHQADVLRASDDFWRSYNKIYLYRFNSRSIDAWRARTSWGLRHRVSC